MSPFVSVAWSQGTSTAGSANVQCASADDVQFAQITPGAYTESAALYIPYISEATCAGIRFALPIPNAATITTAELELTYRSYGNTWATPDDDRIVGIEQVDNAASITTRQNCLDRYTNVGTTVTWTNNTAATQHALVPNCPDLASIIQTVINRAGWASGNYLAVWLYHASGAATDHGMMGYDATASYRPRLLVEYTT